MRILILTFMMLCTLDIYANKACSRIAIINGGEVLVDPSASRKGEGLRHYIERDELAKEYLDKYQSTTTSRIRTAVLGTTGTGLILSSFITNTSNKNKRALLIAGTSTLIINFLLAKTIDSGNEAYLEKSIEEYNKRNFPKILLKSENGTNKFKPTVYLGKSWSF